jgi:hypothetical protein
MAKLISSEMVCRAADSTLQLFGGAGYRLNVSGARFARSGFWNAPLKSCASPGPATCCAIRHAESQLPLTKDGSHDHAN